MLCFNACKLNKPLGHQKETHNSVSKGLRLRQNVCILPLVLNSPSHDCDSEVRFILCRPNISQAPLVREVKITKKSKYLSIKRVSCKQVIHCN